VFTIAVAPVIVMGAVPMDEKTLRVVWLASGAALFYFSVNAWLASTDAGFHLPGVELPRFHKAIIYGTLAIPLVFFVVWVSHEYARLRSNLDRSLRIPAVLERGLESGNGLVVRWIVFVGFVVVPVAAQLHFLNQILSGTVFARNGGPVASGPFEMLTKPLPLCRNCWRFGDAHGVEFFPFVQPWGLVVAVLVLLMYFVRLLLRIAANPQTAPERGD
jgi:hypothetical protein